MKKLNSISQVAEFHKTFKAPILETPKIPSKERCELRVSLLQEELEELKEAINNGDIVEISDALCDLQYVLSGAVLEFGLAEKFKKLFDEVHRSNMSKSCQSKEEAQETLQHYKEKDGTTGRIEKVEDRFIVYRESDNKVLKSINYSPANLKKILKKR